MYAGRFWAVRFWAPRYWPKAGAAGITALILTTRTATGDSIAITSTGDGAVTGGGQA